MTKARVAKLPLRDWVAFLERHPELKEAFEYEVMHLMSEIMAHTITLHLLDAPGPRAPLHAQAPRALRADAEEGARLLPQPLGRDAEPPEAARQDLTAGEAQRLQRCEGKR